MKYNGKSSNLLLSPRLRAILLGNGGNQSHNYTERKKAGTSTVFFKIGSKTCKTKVTVKKYTNPVKSLTISGVNSGKTLKSKFKSSSSASGKLTTTTRNAKIVLKAADGWKIQDLSLSSSSGVYQSYSSYSSPKSSATLRVGTLKKSSYYVSATLVNTKTEGTITLSYSIN